MTTFWIIAALLLFGSALFVLVPLFRKGSGEGAQVAELNLTIRRDQLKELEADLTAGTIGQDQFEHGRLEIERQLLEEVDAEAPKALAGGGRGLAAVAAMLVPMVALGIYFKIGTRQALLPTATMAPSAADASHEVGQDQLAGMVATLAERLQSQPDDAEGWMMLGRSYAVMRQFDKSAEAYSRARGLIGDHPDVLSNYADSLAMANGGRFTERSVALIDKALEIDPLHQKSLWLGGTDAFERGDYPRALELWERLSAQLEPGSDVARTMAANVAEVRALSRGETPPSAMPAPEAAPAPAAVASISGTVTVDPSLTARVDPNAVLFVYAKAPSGPPMPLAILRLSATELPLSFTLDETMAMMPQMSLTRFPEVMVGARISVSGNAMAQPGDLQGLIGPIRVGESGLSIVINEVVSG